MPRNDTSYARGIHLAFLVILSCLLVPVVAATMYDSLPSAVRGAVDFLTTCPYRLHTHRPCPLCGGTGALAALLDGNLSLARALNARAVFVAPGIAMQLPYRIARVIRPRFSWREEALLASACMAAGILLYAV